MRPRVIGDVGGFTRRTTVEELVQRHDRHRGRSKSANQFPHSTTEIYHSLSFAHNTQSKKLTIFTQISKTVTISGAGFLTNMLEITASSLTEQTQNADWNFILGLREEEATDECGMGCNREGLYGRLCIGFFLGSGVVGLCAMCFPRNFCL
jgi:hypothetical protein